MPTKLKLYRGEWGESGNWPPPEIRLMFGMMYVRNPWGSSVPEVWNKLTQAIAAGPGSGLAEKVKMFAQNLRANGKEYALAAAWTRGGSYTYDYKYVIDIPSAYLFYWAEDGNRPTKGAPVQFANPAQVDQEFIVLDKPDVSQSKILAFGHRAGTNEITFFSDIPRGYVRSCNDTPTFKIKYMTWKEVPFDLKAGTKYRLQDVKDRAEHRVRK